MENSKIFLVGADFHGSITALENFLDLSKFYKADKLILLGDIFGINSSLMVEKLNQVANKLTIVKGNNDWYFESSDAEFTIFKETYENLNGRIAYLCHGHRLNDMDLQSYGAKIILQGHVHRPFILKEQGVIRVCPGSLAAPRHGSSPSFALIDEKTIKILSLNGQLIEQTSY